MNLREWGNRWGVAPGAIDELAASFGVGYHAPTGKAGSESRVTSEVLLESAARGWLLWRNNVGALMDKTGRPVRYGLCNDSKALNDVCKSADLVGIRPLLITADLVGRTVGQFASVEVKENGWQYTGDAHETAQLRWATMVEGAGGYAQFVNAKGQLK